MKPDVGVGEHQGRWSLFGFAAGVASIAALLFTLGTLAASIGKPAAPARSSAAAPTHARQFFLLDQAMLFRTFVAEIQGSSYYSKWSAQNPGELARWASYRDAVLANVPAEAPSMSTHFGSALVLAGQLARPPPPPVTTTVTSTVTSTSTTTVPTTVTAPTTTTTTTPSSSSTSSTTSTTSTTTTPASASGFGISSPCDQICYQTAAQKDEEFADMAALGVGWVRIDLRWSVIETNGPTGTNWASFDDTVSRARAHGLKVLAIIHSTPGWAGPSAEAPPTNIADWSRFVTKAAAHEGAAVKAYELWNEENGGFFSGSVAQYTALLRSGYDAIKAVDATDTVLLGGLVPQGGDYTYPTSEVQFLKGVYANGGKGYFDAVADHPYIGGGYNALSDQTWSGWFKMARSPESVRSVMVANGDAAKRIWATEWGHHLGGYLPDASEQQIQQNIAVDVATWKTYTWAGPLFYYTDRDDGSTGGFGLSSRSYPLQHLPRWSSFQAAIR